jgi:hypothetical protein
MAISGIRAYLALGNASNTLTPVSEYLDSIQGASDTDQLDGTTFQPGVQSPIRVQIPGFTTRTSALSGKWTAAAETFFNSIDGLLDRLYEYGPDDNTAGKVKISGTCNVSGYTGPQSEVGSITTFSLNLNINTRTVGTF